MLALVITIIAIVSIFFAKDSYINTELNVYQTCLQKPWLHRLVLLKYLGEIN